MGWPKTYSDFHITTKYAEVKGQVNESALSVLHGKSGYGKSATAVKLVDDLSGSHPILTTRHIKWWLISSTEETLGNSLLDFCKLHDPPLTPLKEFKKLFDLLNRGDFASQVKWFVFDDMDMAELFGKELAPCLECLLGDAELSNKWRIIITTKQAVPEHLNQRATMVPFEGFTPDDSIGFFPGAPERTVQMVHDKFSGSPHALRIAKKEFPNLSCFDDDVMRELDRMADRSSLRGHDQKETVALLELIIKKNFGSGVLHELLGCIAFFDEHNISEELLHSCMEVLTPKDDWDEIKKSVNNLREKMTDLCLTSLIPSNKTAVTIHELTREALRVYFHDSGSEEKRFCSYAMTALTRVLDTDGRFPGRLPSENMAHARKLAKFLEKKPPIFMRDDVMLMHAEILYALAYAELKQRSPAETALKKLKHARDLLCRWLSGKNYEKFKGKRGLDSNRIGKDLYKASSMADSGNYSSHAKHIQQFRRLTDKDFNTLGVRPSVIQNRHLTVTANTLQDLRKPEHNGALGEEKFIRLFAAECVAQVFYLMARIPSFFVDDCPMELAKEAIHCAEVAKSMYERIEAESEVKILNKVLVRREELHNRLHVIGQEEHAPETGQAEATEILRGYEGMLNLTGNAYEYGIKRSKLEEDDYHKMLCRERMLLCHGWLVHFGKADSRAKGQQLYEQCRSNAEREKRKSTCLSNVEEFHAKFLFLCGEPDKTVCKALIDALKHLHDAAYEQKQSVVQQGRFRTLCKLLRKYVREPVALDDQTISDLESLIKECDQAQGAEEERKILNDVRSQKMRPIEGGEEEQRERFSEVAHPEHDQDGQPDNR